MISASRVTEFAQRTMLKSPAMIAGPCNLSRIGKSWSTWSA